MRRCEDEKVWRWEDVKMRRCERRCEDEKVWRWEDVLQTPTIGRTLRSDALGKNEATLWDFLQKWTFECRADGLVPMRFEMFPLHLSKVLRLPGKSEARPHKVLHLSRKITLANLKIWCSKMQPLSGNQRPDLLTSLTNMSPVLRLPRDMHLSF